MNQFGLSFLLMWAAFGVDAVAADDAVFTDPVKAGPDYKIQGEYLGEMDLPEGKIVYSVELVARGDGKFLAVAYPGGLRGEGASIYERGTGWGKTTDGVTSFVADNGKSKGIMRGETLVITNVFGEQYGTMKKVARKSPTLGVKPPEGALVLFDGSDTEHFENGRLSEDKVLKAGGTTKGKFQNFTLHIEFRTPFMPSAKGQERGNSGVYLQGRYEIQILDSFGLEAQKDSCGAIYSVAAPNIEMSYPPLCWQTYDIDFTAAHFDQTGKKTESARVTVKQNGVLVHDHVKIPNATPGGLLEAESPEPGPLYFQDHGCPVEFRNVWIVDKT
jgi:hypothetical protein